jgi:ATP-dependent DNA ligase
MPPVLPMLAKRVDTLPSGDDWVFEPKWDGFRALVFRDGDEVYLQSRDEKPLARYFPELLAPLRAALPPRVVLDGEIVLVRRPDLPMGGSAPQPHGGSLDFEALQLRLHPAASRVKLLAAEMPASIVFWDLLSVGDDDLRAAPFHERRARLEQLLAGAAPPVHLTPATADRALAEDWFRRFEGAGLDGVMAKSKTGGYEPNKRAMIKVKHERTCECVVGGFRWHKDGEGTLVGSLLLGLHDDAGRLQHVGVSASFTTEKRRELASFLAPYRQDALRDHPWKDWAGGEGGETGAKTEAPRRAPGMQSRWSGGKSMAWEPLRPELVVEVAYDHLQGRRFRHTTQLRRFRVDKAPADCRYDQLETTPPYELGAIFGAR